MTYTMTEFVFNAHNKEEAGEIDFTTAVEADSFFQDIIDFENASSSSATGTIDTSDGLGDTSTMPESFLAGLDGLPLSSAADLLDFHLLSQATANGRDHHLPAEDGTGFGFKMVANQEATQEQQPQQTATQQAQGQHHQRGASEPAVAVTNHQAPETSFPMESISDAELLKLEGISIQSPGRQIPTFSQSPSPPPATSLRKASFLESVSSTIKKATTNFSRTTTTPRQHGARSPARNDQRPHALAPPTFPSNNGQFHSRPSLNSAPMPARPRGNNGGNGLPFVSGFVEDPFAETASVSVPTISRVGGGGAREADARRGHAPRSVSMVVPDKSSWPNSTDGTTPWTEQEFAALQATLAGLPQQDWWELGQQQQGVSPARHMSQTGAGFELGDQVNTKSNGNNHLIHMPQPRQVQPDILHDLNMSAANYLPQAPQQQQQQQQQQGPHGMLHHHHHGHGHPHHERTRPPRAPSSSTRHMSTPMRRSRTRSESTSPSRAVSRGRHASGESSSIGRRTESLAAASPGSTPHGHSIRKRRSSRMREPRTRSCGGGSSVSSAGAGSGSGSGSGSGGGGGASGGSGIGFVNFTPEDCQMIMTGVAPSGSSKTKAKREREAMERRKKLSEAAMKAVEAAGGDVEKLNEVTEGFMVY